MIGIVYCRGGDTYYVDVAVYYLAHYSDDHVDIFFLIGNYVTMWFS